jgi:cytochrome P450
VDLITLAVDRLGGVLPGLLRAPFEHVTGFVQMVVGPSAVRATLDLAGLTVPYGERARLLGLGAFPLACDGSDHDSSRRTIAAVLASSSGAHRVAVHEAAAAAHARMLQSERVLDVVDALIDPTAAFWAERWFGLDGEGPALLRTSRMITHAMFFNPKVPKGRVDAIGLERAKAWVEQHRIRLAARVGTARPGTLTAHLLAATGGDTDLTARHLLGLTVGPLALGTYSIANAVDHLLGQAGAFDRIARAVDPRANARGPFLDALRAAPPLAGVIRTSPGIAIPEPGRATPVHLPAGPVLVATGLTMGMPDPGFPRDHLAFGHGPHRCLGPTESTDIGSVILAALAARSPARSPGEPGTLRPGPAPSAVSGWVFPGSLEVTLAPVRPT